MFIKNCVYSPNPNEEDTIGVYDLISPFMLERINSAYSKEERGVDSTEDWDAANDAMIAGIHIMIMSLEAHELYRAGALDMNALRDKYKVECARKNLACLGFDLDDLLSFFGLNTGQNFVDGINFMNVEDGDNVQIVG